MSNKILTTVLSIVALTSCSTLNNKNSNADNKTKELRPELVVLKQEDTPLNDHTVPIKKEDIQVRNNSGYLYLGEMAEVPKYIDRITSIVDASIERTKKDYMSDSPEYSKFEYTTNPSTRNNYFIKIKNGVREEIDMRFSSSYSKYIDPDADEQYFVKPLKRGSQSYRQVVDVNGELVVKVRREDTGEETDINLGKVIKSKDPVAEFNKLFGTEVIRYKDIKDGFDNGRVQVEVATADNDFGKKEFKGDTLYNLEKYTDLVGNYGGEATVQLKLGVDGRPKNRNSLIKVKVDFSEKIEDYSNDYNQLFDDISKNPIKFDDKGNLVGGFNNYLVEKLLAPTNGENTENLSFRTRILDSEDKSVGMHKVVREIVKDGKVLASKEDNTFVGFPGPTVLVADLSFFDAGEDLAKRIYRKTPYYVEPRFDYIAEEEANLKLYEGNNAIPESYKKTILQKARLRKTHGTTVLETMVDELAYGHDYFQKSNIMAKVATEALLDLSKGEVQNERNILVYKNAVEELSKQLANDLGDKPKIKNATDKILQSLKDNIEPLLDKEKSSTMSEDDKKTKLKAHYEIVLENAKEMKNIKLDEKLKDTNIHFETIAIGGKDGRSTTSSITGLYLPKILDENPHIKVLNMSYGNDINFEDYVKADNMSDADKQKAVDEFNKNGLYRYLVIAWLKSEKERINQRGIAENSPSATNPLFLDTYFENKKKITVKDFERLLEYKRSIIKNQLLQSAELVAANHDVLLVRSQGNTYGQAQVNLTDFATFGMKGGKAIVDDPNLKYNNSFTSIPSMINYLKAKEAAEEGKDYEYDYKYRKNILGVVGLVYKGTENSNFLPNSEKFNNYTLGATINRSIEFKNQTPGMLDRYMELVKEYNRIIVANDVNKYPKEYEEYILKQIKEIEDYSFKFGHVLQPHTFSRAGAARLWTVAANGEYVYVSDVDTRGKAMGNDYDENYSAESGSSFAAPRVTAVAGAVQYKFPWMSAHQIKQTILTTADDDVYYYGVDENIGWGILNKDKALKGPARFVKALTKEDGKDKFVANISSGVYEFSNDIEGAFDKASFLANRGAISAQELELFKNPENTNTTDKTPEKIKEVLDKGNKYFDTLPFEYKELFEEAGFVKEGKGTIVFSGVNTYKGDTDIKEGTLVERGGSLSNHFIFENGTLMLDLKYIQDSGRNREETGKPVGAISAEVHNKGNLYSLSEQDNIRVYVPYNGSKTYIAPDAMLSVGALALDNIDNFKIDVYKIKGNPLTLKRKSGFPPSYEPKKIFEANINDKYLTKVQFGEYRISYGFSVKLSYENKKLIAMLKGYDAKSLSNDATPVATEDGLAEALAELRNKMSGVREDLDREAEERAKKINELLKDLLEKKKKEEAAENEEETSNNSVAENNGEGSNDTSETTPPAPPLPPAPPAPPVPSVTSNSERINSAIDRLMWASEEEISEIDGSVLGESLKINYDLEELKLSSLNKQNDKELKAGETYTFAKSLNKFILQKGHPNTLVFDLRLDGIQVGILKQLDKRFKLGLSFDYINGGNYNNEKVAKNTVNSIGLNGMFEFKEGNFKLNANIGLTTVFKNIFKNILFEDPKYTKHTSFNITNQIGVSYEAKVHDKISLKPSLSLDTYAFVFNKYEDEKDSLLGMKYDSQLDYKVSTKLGLESIFDISDKVKLNLGASTNLWLSDPNIKLIAKYVANDSGTVVKSNNISRVTGEFNINLNTKPTNNLSVDLEYNVNTKNEHKFNLGLGYKF